MEVKEKRNSDILVVLPVASSLHPLGYTGYFEKSL
jgi:hypothetical protein